MSACLAIDALVCLPKLGLTPYYTLPDLVLSLELN